jgi:exonuclease III
VFVSQSLAPRIVSCIALNGGDPDPWEFSDHCPVILELRL